MQFFFTPVLFFQPLSITPIQCKILNAKKLKDFQIIAKQIQKSYQLIFFSFVFLQFGFFLFYELIALEKLLTINISFITFQKFIFFLMEDIYKHCPVGPASKDQISIELYSKFKLTEDVRAEIAQHFTSKLTKLQGNRLLIIGAQVGVMARLLEPYCSHIDLIAEEEYIPILQSLFVKGQSVEYTFNREGFIGEKHLIPKYKPTNCTKSVIEISKFKDHIKRNAYYDIILLQNVIVHPKINILKQLMRLQHQVLITMIIPGKLIHPNLFQLLSGIQQNILQVFYNQATHERVEYIKYITGRRQQINFWEIFVWIKKDAPDSEVQLAKVQNILTEQVKKNTVKAEKNKGETGVQIYQSKTSTNQYLDFHYGETEYFGVKNFPLQCALKTIDAAKSENIKGRVLDLGCAVGRTTVQLASYFDEVVGIDFSNAFIQAANKVLAQKYSNLSGKVKFLQGDACNLSPQIGHFDVIFAGNLIDRLYDPEAFLHQIVKFLKSKSILILTSPYTWLQEYTKVQKWIGGRQINGKNVSTYQGIREIITGLGLKQLKNSQDIRFVICENPWVYQYTNAQMTYWIKL